MLRKKLNKSVIVFEITAQSSYFCGDGIPFRAYLSEVKILLVLLFSQMCLLHEFIGKRKKNDLKVQSPPMFERLFKDIQGVPC